MDAQQDDYDDDTCVQTKSYFEHEKETLQLVDALVHDPESGAAALKRLNDIFDTYQEQAHLLDPHLDALIQPVIAKLRQDIEQTTPAGPEATHALFRYLYLLSKTRGYKTIVKFMSHEVSDLEPVFDFLSSLDTSIPDYWESRYIGLIWLSLICMIPFDLKRVDSSSEHESQIPLIDRMLALCKHYLKSTGKERDGASILVARLLSRQDLCGNYLVPFIEWSMKRLNEDADVFEATGILTSLCITFQISPRSALLPTLDDFMIPLLSMPALCDRFANNSLIRKIRMKLTQRVGLCYLKPKVASWRYQRGNRSLRQNLEGTVPVSDNTMKAGLATEKQEESDDDEDDDDIPDNLEVIIEILLGGLRDKDTIVRWSAAKGIGRITQRLPRDLAQDVVRSLLELFEENTLVNRTTNKLDLTAVSDNTWHGASLAVAELARRGLLLPDRLKETIPWIIHGLKFDLKRGSHSIGSHVRDAACYVCWSFARAYAPHILVPFVQEIAQNLVVVSVFDREINVRRASSAAFQENVGRQGIFPRGIEIIQIADYFSVGNRTNAFMHVAVEIAKFEEYRYPLIDHLVTVTARHWDKTMRILASQAIHLLVPLAPMYFIDNILPILIPMAVSKDMQISHGAMLSVAEICLSLYSCRQQDTVLDHHWQSQQSLIQSIACITALLPPRSLTTFGSEHVREAACHLVECLARTYFPVLDVEGSTTLMAWKTLVHTSLERKEENVQQHAVYAFGALYATYPLSKEELDDCINKIASTRFLYGRRGYALALGTLSFHAVERHAWLHNVIMALCCATRMHEEQQANDAESKRNAVIGLSHLLEKLENNDLLLISECDHEHILQTLQTCLLDYSTDQRGDVGSWVRMASMDCLASLIPRLVQLQCAGALTCVSSAKKAEIMAGLLKQGVERIDRVRANAGTVIRDFIYAKQGIPLDIPGQSMLEKYIAKDLDWSSPAMLYPVMVNLLALPEYRFDLLTGLIASAGGMTESLVRHSSACLIDYADRLPVTADETDLCLELVATDILQIFANYEKQDRVTIPLLDVVGLLYESAVFTKISKESIHSKILQSTRKEALRCKSIRKLLAVIKIYVGLMNMNGTQVKIRAMQQMLSYLVHAFPRIRMEASDQLYTYLSLLDAEDMTDGTMAAEEVLTTTDWADSVDQIKPVRDTLYEYFAIPKPVLKSTK
ncbi:tubulin folding cofactor D C terminal-domain-containing protein [Radiomyces spectabilis]|uniref:tubulin folding cofactor D C terminal-domain-containing protein n=1 Tax=Radiomyces spectabilis TaxID=64574 RepID=UPI00222025B2|nr:tubulin folding cofactor D C terminal-domain-containing protein [Radiomyces spectabilis]KAI8380956.1 tubulin folding cofactor D C terminal-domain-containing protein [Radiomyces spectabilis]